jgi:uncharacterized membrane protein
MSFSDFMLINSGSLMSYGIGFVALGFVYFLFKDLFDDDEVRSWFKGIIWCIALVMLLFLGFSLVKSLYTHTERTTIDRSVGDESQQELQDRIEKGESR